MRDLATLLKALLMLLAMVALAWGFKQLALTFGLDQHWVDTHIRQHGLQGVASFIALAAVAMACGLPRQLAAFLGGYAFGFITGTLLATLAATLGCMLSFYVARFVARRWVQARFARQAGRIDRFLGHQTVRKTLLIRLLPLGSNLLTNLIAGISHAPAWRFFTGQALGYIPQMAIFALAGSGVTLMSGWKIALSVLLLLVSSALGLHLYRQQKRHNPQVFADTTLG